ncbi:aminoglycoside phosphotransferase [Mycolicibacterium mageritense DSM 44476 = CIP 104973]|uniref:Aminoglycoside phosphotransferase n=1 Tax=Mycolicibacterium mageritense TaxID=53462 RepID=A0ABM7HQ42_MYCME|nr:phosphotransferase [Mycolicibacterium mageritense]MBN3454726.1 phosphotransferase [Mycobacterium sp. DSM 3803]MCC9180262.1 phosphotransferase [Mycolicibacterium mageritense]TXI65001.1 MAG: aminoglycoside phosphotransferase [Mycolicibacterium mageritense]CDO22809.1 aminoglycoside phosphotransferase [Mycolicibacterium mageritense DSM 44476 = CIP 104973]BBX32650.1 aminoglycoside phosphotransferase [Mycolicibacterium mageritense]
MVVVDDIAVARAALDQYDISAEATLRLLNLSENATYLVEDRGTQSILRVHRENYHRPHEIESELDWLAALRADSDVTVPTVLPARDGSRLVTVEVNGNPRHIVHFDMVAGSEPDENALTLDDFHLLGRITAALHEHSQRWTRPAGFGRFSWDWEHSLGDQPRWGRWLDAEGVGDSERQVLERAQDLLHRRLVEYGTGPERFGLIHADLRLANLLVDPVSSGITVIDFDDCGFGWYFYDFGTAVSFIEDDPKLPEWQESWVSGYRSRRELPTEDEDMLASFVLLRRLLLLAWMGSHSHSKESATKAISYAAGSCALADRYLSSNGRSLT